jgi:predicted permease
VELQMAYLLVGVNCLRLLLTAISQPMAISVSWDSAGIATGPIAVPFVLSLGLGLAKSLGGSSTGFGLVALMAGGIVVVMLLVMMLLMRSSRQRQQSA